MHSKLLLVGSLAATWAMASACLSGASRSTASPTTAAAPQLVVGCNQVIGRAQSPTADGFRRVLSVISVPPIYVPQVVRIHGQDWPYWEKAGMVVRANRSPVSVSVPLAWRKRAAITWGNGKLAVSSVRFSACPSPPNVWDAYAGGFFLATHGACVPLLFQVGHESRVVRFGIDRRCD